MSSRILFFIRATFLVLIVAAITSSCGEEEVQPVQNMPEEEMEETTEEVDKVDPIEGTIRDISSMELVAEMGVGWNLGNAFDVRSKNKTLWGNPLPSSDQVNAAHDMGFTTLRIPITWEYNQLEESPYTIEQAYLTQVQRIVNDALNKDMHVIINTHHDDWIIPTNAEAAKVEDRLTSLWTQVANHFIEYGDKLIFETLNEPRLMGSPEEWSGGTQEGRTVVNQLHQASVNAIRATGGNNGKRHIMISTYAASTTSNAMRDLVVPDDPNIIISTHSYFPWSFAGQDAGGTNSWGTDAEKAALDAELDRIKNRWVTQENRPVILGEWGAKNKNNLTTRIDYVSYYAQAAVSRGMLPIIWDDGGDFGLYDRNAKSWKFPEIAEAVVAADN